MTRTQTGIFFDNLREEEEEEEQEEQEEQECDVIADGLVATCDEDEETVEDDEKIEVDNTVLV